jgi:hypothetical protein
MLGNYFFTHHGEYTEEPVWAVDKAVDALAQRLITYRFDKPRAGSVSTAGILRVLDMLKKMARTNIHWEPANKPQLEMADDCAQ